jgi:DNA polymerase V
MQALDKLNQRYERGTVKVSTKGAFKEWQMLQERKSPNYTTAWDEVPVV